MANKDNKQTTKQGGIPSGIQFSGKASNPVIDPAKAKALEDELKVRAEAAKAAEEAKAKAEAEAKANAAKAEADKLAAFTASQVASQEAEAKAKAAADAAKAQADAAKAKQEADNLAKIKTEAEALALTAKVEKLKANPAYADAIRAMLSISDETARGIALKSFIGITETNERQEIIIQKPNRVAKLLTDLRNSEGPVAKAVVEVVKANSLDLTDMEDKFVHLTFQGGKVIVTADLKSSVTKEGRETGPRAGHAVGTIAFYQEGTEKPVSAHAFAEARKIKYESIRTSKEVLAYCETFLSNAYIRPDGTPILKPGTTGEKDSDYIRTEAMAKTLGIDLTSAIKNGRKFHPFYYTWTEAGTLDGKPVFKVEKHERQVSASGDIVGALPTPPTAS